MIEYLRGNSALVLDALAEHVVLSLLPLVAGVLLALPLGAAAARWDRLHPVVVGAAGVVYSVPSLALFVALPYVLGTRVLSPVNVAVALAVYTLALMTRTVADGLRSVDPALTEAATAMGYRSTRRLLGVELPLALPVIAAGVRVAAVSNISLVSVGALIGVGGLGDLFTRGFQLSYPEPIVVGIVLSLLLAALADGVLVLLQRWATPWTRVAAGGR